MITFGGLNADQRFDRMLAHAFESGRKEAFKAVLTYDEDMLAAARQKAASQQSENQE